MYTGVWYVPWLHSILLAITDGNIYFCENATNSLVERLTQILAEICDDLGLAVDIDGTKVAPALKRFHKKYFRKIQISEAAVERVFSKHKMIHTELRNSLREITVEKTLFIKNAYPDFPLCG